MPNLSFNILTFDHPEPNKDFFFVTEKQEGFFPLRNFRLPANVSEILGIDDLEKEVPLYTNFLEDVESDLKLTVSLEDSPEFALHYYRTRIFDFFIQEKLIAKFNYINDIEVWLEAKDVTDNETTYFHKIGLRVQFARVSDKPELLVYYIGKSRIVNESLANLENEISTTNYKKVLYKNRVYSYQKGLPDYVLDDMEAAFPMVNYDLINTLELESGFEKVENRYVHIHKYIKGFYIKYLSTAKFRKIIPINEDGFLKVREDQLDHTSPESNLLQFGNGVGVVPKKEIWRKKAFFGQPHKNLHFIFIYHKDSTAAFDKALSYFSGNEDFKGIKGFIKVPFYHDKVNSIIYENQENPLPEIAEKLRPFKPTENLKYVAIYISPITKEEKSKALKEVYFKVKQLLLESQITSQVIEEETIFQKDFKWSMTNIGLALLAKLDGIPWKLKPEMEDEMIFGVGAFINQEIGVRFLGNTFCFSNDGLFKEFECYAENELFLLAGKIEMGILNFKKKHRNKNPKRLIIHFYKTMSDKELKPILKALEKLKTPIPVFVVTINKTESEDYLVFDENYIDLMPESGTIINIGRSEFLLCNNSKYNLEDKVALDGYHLPVKLKLSCSKPELLTDEVATELIDQVYQFSRMYWKALKQQNLPVTIKYPEMVARIAPHFDGGIIPIYGRKNLWFL